MTVKMADWTLCSKGLHSLGRELGLWTGEETDEHELEGHLLGARVALWQQLNSLYGFQKGTVLQATEIAGTSISTRIN